jgi:hypothetical protein
MWLVLPELFIDPFSLLSADYNPKSIKIKGNCQKSLQLQKWANSLIGVYWLGYQH